MSPNIFVVTFVKAMESDIKVVTLIHLEKLQQDLDGTGNGLTKYYPFFLANQFYLLNEIKCLM